MKANLTDNQLDDLAKGIYDGISQAEVGYIYNNFHESIWLRICLSGEGYDAPNNSPAALFAGGQFSEKDNALYFDSKASFERALVYWALSTIAEDLPK